MERLEYKPWEDEIEEGLVGVIDHAARECQAMNREIYKQEYAHIFPERKTSRDIHLRFNCGKVKYIGRKMAEYMVKKFKSLEIVDGGKTAPVSEAVQNWEDLLEKIKLLKLRLAEAKIPSPKTGVSREEKEAFVAEAERLLGEVEQ